MFNVFPALINQIIIYMEIIILIIIIIHTLFQKLISQLFIISLYQIQDLDLLIMDTAMDQTIIHSIQILMERNIVIH